VSWGWETLPPVPANGQELIRATSGGSLQVIVFKMRSHDLPAAEIAARAQAKLEPRGFTDFTVTEVPFAGTAGSCLRFRYQGEDRPGRTSWEYFAVRGPAVFVLGLSSAEPDTDLATIDTIAAGFELTSTPSRTPPH
jgi:hypothetical protein